VTRQPDTKSPVPLNYLPKLPGLCTGLFFVYTPRMDEQIIEVDAADAESVEDIMDFVAGLLKQGHDLDDITASMLCVVSTLLENPLQGVW